MPVYTMTCDHEDIRDQITALKNAINSGSDHKIKESLARDLRVVVDKIRDHMAQEDEILYTLALSEFTEDELIEMARVIEDERDNAE